MVCCFLPFMRAKKSVVPMLIFTEVVRYGMIVVPIYLSVWRYAERTGYTSFLNTTSTQEVGQRRTQFWLAVTGILVAASLVVYLPVKIGYIWWKYKAGHLVRSNLAWRPSILIYILSCGGPCLGLLAYAARASQKDICKTNPHCVMDSHETIVIQVVVMGLTVTEWMSKIREEVLSYDLISAMSVDFFFAYDVIEFLMMPQYETQIFRSNWLYVTFVFAFIAMFKYIPSQPSNSDDDGATTNRVVTCILVQLFCNDLSFIVIRITTMAVFSFRAGDLIHPVKNVALIFFGLTQLYIVHYNKRKHQDEAPVVPSRRITRKTHESVKKEKKDGAVEGYGSFRQNSVEPKTSVIEQPTVLDPAVANSTL